MSCSFDSVILASDWISPEWSLQTWEEERREGERSGWIPSACGVSVQSRGIESGYTCTCVVHLKVCVFAV